MAQRGPAAHGVGLGGSRARIHSAVSDIKRSEQRCLHFSAIISPLHCDVALRAE